MVVDFVMNAVRRTPGRLKTGGVPPNPPATIFPSLWPSLFWDFGSSFRTLRRLFLTRCRGSRLLRPRRCGDFGLVSRHKPAEHHFLGADHEHEIVHGAKVLEETVVPAVLLRWLMKRPVSPERLALLVSVCFFIATTVVAESPGAAVTATVVAAPLNCKSTLYTSCRVFCVPCDFRQGDVCSWTVLTCGHIVYLQRTTRDHFDRRFLAG